MRAKRATTNNRFTHTVSAPMRLKPQDSSLRPLNRRGTALIFVLGMLTLLSLVGLILISRTHGEFQRINNQSSNSLSQSAMDGVIRSIQETLRRDIWGNDPNPQLPLTNTGTGIAERNEPWDAPGQDDRWLASLMPYDAGTSPNSSYVANLFPPATGDPVVAEQNVLAWPWVSYEGTDIISPDHTKTGVQPYAWPYNSRENPPPATPLATSCRFYSSSNLQNVPILQTPPPIHPAASTAIPGSTTDVTIASARIDWKNKLANASYSTALATAIGAGAGSPKVPLFPYFDTNADGILDLYDADGDGIPDSPLSFVVPVDTADPNSPKDLYAAIRIVDHEAMLNVNVASSLGKAGGTATEMTFDEARPGLQRRGQRTADLLLDDVLHADDHPYGVTTDRARGLMSARSGSFPDIYDRDFVKTKLIGGRFTGATSYYPFGLADESSLRHRGSLVPYDRRFDSAISDFGNIDRALKNTLLWGRAVDASNNYTSAVSRWTRLGPNEGYDAPGASGTEKGWRLMMSEDEPFALRRQLFTTMSHDVVIGPDIVRNNLVCSALTTADAQIDCALQRLWALGMDWPVLISTADPILTAAPPWWTSNPFSQKFLVAPDKLPPPTFRVQQIDLNMGDANTAAAKEAFVRYAAAGMYLALEGVTNYQGIKIVDDPLTPQNELLNREYLAWQFAANLADYRDADDEPTAIEWPASSGHFVFGLEKQPFFTEAYAHLEVPSDTGSGPVGDSGDADKWFFAVELYVPPYWQVPTNNLYFRAPRTLGAPRIYPLNYFLNGGTPPGILDGGTTGQYFVFCGIDADAPDSFRLPGGAYNTAYHTFYQFVPHPGLADFALQTDGTGRAELLYRVAGLPDHVLDVIGPQQSGGPMANDPTNTRSGMGVWAAHVASMRAGDKHEFSLIRSTNGWRFTTAWQVYDDADAGGPIGSSGSAPQQSLGRSNEIYANSSPANHTYKLTQNIPESIWPARGLYGASTGLTGFEAGVPFSAFDTPGDLGKMLVVGPLTQTNAMPPTIVQIHDASATDFVDAPATVLLSSIANYGIGGTTPSVNPTPGLEPVSKDRLAAGHVDLAPYTVLGNAQPNNGMKWLFSYFTTQSPLFDGVDNDGNGLIDMADPLEGYAVLNRIAGRLNVNTAPATVLRSVPYMSLLPTSAEYLFHFVTNDGQNAIPPGYDPFTVFNVPTPRPFWDMASAIVASRENRQTALRMLDPNQVLSAGVTSQMRTVAIASVPPPVPPFSSSSFRTLKGAMQSVADLVRMTDRLDVSPSGDSSLFDMQRFVRPGNARLPEHKYIATDPAFGLGSVFSPDYRLRRTSNNSGFVEYPPVVAQAAPLQESGGLRARDVFISRWANVLSTRSDVFTAYIALIDENGHYVQRSQITFDRSPCFRETPGQPRMTILPDTLNRVDTSYTDDTK